MQMDVKCAGCGKVYRLDDALAGRTIRCKQCGTAFKISAPTKDDGASFLDALSAIEAGSGGSGGGDPRSPSSSQSSSSSSPPPAGASWPSMPAPASSPRPAGKRRAQGAAGKPNSLFQIGEWGSRAVMVIVVLVALCIICCAGVIAVFTWKEALPDVPSVSASGADAERETQPTSNTQSTSMTLPISKTQLASRTASNRTALCSVESLAIRGPGDYKFVEVTDYIIGVHGIHYETLPSKPEQWIRVWIPLHKWGWGGGRAPVIQDPTNQSPQVRDWPVAAVFCSDKIHNEADLLAVFKRQTLVGEVFEKASIDPKIFPKLIGRGGTLNPQTAWLIVDSAEAPPVALVGGQGVQGEPPAGAAETWKVNEASEPLLAEPVDIGGYTLRPLKSMETNGRGSWVNAGGNLITLDAYFIQKNAESESREFPTLGDAKTQSPSGRNVYVRNFGNVSQTLGKINGLPAVRYLTYFERLPGGFDHEFHYFVLAGDRLIDLRFRVSDPKSGTAEADAVAATLKRSWMPPVAINDEDCPVLKPDPKRAKELGDRVAIGGISFQLPRDCTTANFFHRSSNENDYRDPAENYSRNPNSCAFYWQKPKPSVQISFSVGDRKDGQKGLFVAPINMRWKLDLSDPSQAKKADVTYRRVGAFNVTRFVAMITPPQAGAEPYIAANYLIPHGNRVVIVETLPGSDDIPVMDEMIASIRPGPARVSAVPVSNTKNPPTSIAFASDWSLDSGQMISIGAYETVGDFRLRVPYGLMKFLRNPQQTPYLLTGTYTTEQKESYTIRVSTSPRRSPHNFLFPRPRLIKPNQFVGHDEYDLYVVDADPGGFRYGRISGIPFVRVFHLASDTATRDGLKGVLDYVGLDGDRVIKISFYGIKSADAVPPEFDEMARSLVFLKPRPPEESLPPTATDGAPELPENVMDAPEWITDKEFENKLPVTGDVAKYSINLPEGAKALSAVDSGSRTWEFALPQGGTAAVSLRVRPRAAGIASTFPVVSIDASEDPKTCDAVMAATSNHARNWGRIDGMPFVRIYSSSLRGAATKNEITYVGLNDKTVITIRLSPATANGDPAILDAVARSLRRAK